MSSNDRTTPRSEASAALDPDVARAALLSDTDLDPALAARLRAESRRTRARIEDRLATAGHLDPGGPRHPGETAGAGAGGVTEVDAWRDLDALQDEHADLLEHIDDLHERRLRSPSPRERRASTRVLAEMLHRIVVGYETEIDRTPRVLAVARRADERLGDCLGRVAAWTGRPAGAVRWWARNGRWVRLPLAVSAGVLFACGAFLAGAAALALRTVLSMVLFSDLPEVRPGRVLGYDPGWAASVIAHLGDAAVLAGLGLGLHVRGHGTLGAATAFVALYSLLASMLRIASGHHGFRLERLWTERVVMTLVSVAVAVAAFAAHGEPGIVGGVPVVHAAVIAVALLGTNEIARTIYWAFRRRRLFRQASHAGAGPVNDVLVTHTSDALVMNIPRRAPRSPVVDGRTAKARDLWVVGGPDR